MFSHFPSAVFSHFPSAVFSHFPSAVFSHLPSAVFSHFPSVVFSHLPFAVFSHLPSAVFSHLPSAVCLVIWLDRSVLLNFQCGCSNFVCLVRIDLVSLALRLVSPTVNYNDLFLFLKWYHPRECDVRAWPRF